MVLEKLFPKGKCTAANDTHRKKSCIRYLSAIQFINKNPVIATSIAQAGDLPPSKGQRITSHFSHAKAQSRKSKMAVCRQEKPYGQRFKLAYAEWKKKTHFLSVTNLCLVSASILSKKNPPASKGRGEE
jgi:hypothetical protein